MKRGGTVYILTHISNDVGVTSQLLIHIFEIKKESLSMLSPANTIATNLFTIKTF